MGFYTTPALLFLLALIPFAVYTARSKRATHAVLQVAFFASLFGPEAAYIKLPLIPPIDKLTLPYILLFVIALTKWRPKVRRAKLFRGVDLLIIVAIIGGFLTMSTNGDPLTYGR